MKVDSYLKGQLWVSCWLGITLGLIPLSSFGFTGPGGVFIKPAWIAGTVLIFSFIYLSLSSRFIIKVTESKKIVLSILAFALFVTVYEIILNNNLAESTITQTLRFLWISLLFLVISSISLTQMKIRRVFKVWLTLIALIAGYNLYVVVVINIGYPELVPITASSEAPGSYLGDYQRPAAIIEPSRFCQYTISPLLSSFMILSLGGNHDKKIFYNRRYINYALFVIILIGYITTMSLGGTIVLSLVLLLILFTSKTHSLKSKLICLVGLATIVAFASSMLYYAFGVSIVYISYVRIYTLVGEMFGYPSIIPDVQYAETSFRTRTIGVKRAFEIVLENPISGLGLGNLAIINVDPLSLSDSARGVHSGILQLTAEIGVVGLMLFTSLYFKIFRSVLSFGAHSNSADSTRVLIYAFVFILLARLIYIIGAGNWINIVVWTDMSIPLLLINSYKNRVNGL